MRKNVNGINELYVNGINQKYYYTTNQVKEITGISERTLRYRVSELKENHKDEVYMRKDQYGNWEIHYSIVDSFMPRTKPRKETPFNMDWCTFLSWTTKENFESTFHNALINQILTEHPKAIFMYCVERSDAGINHVHMLSDVNHTVLSKTASKVLKAVLEHDEFMLDYSPLRCKTSSVRYISKNK